MISGRAKSSKQAALDTFISMIHQNVSIERQNITTLFNSCSDATNLVCCVNCYLQLLINCL